LAYIYAPDRRAAQQITHLASFRGILQTGYAGYKPLAEKAPQYAPLVSTKPDQGDTIHHDLSYA
jgi:hypothetical protein